MYLPVERMVVNDAKLGSVSRYNYYSNGLGEVDGLFNIGKMFTRMFTFTPKSFTVGNILGSIGSVTSTVATGGLIALAPKIQSARSTVSKIVGGATLAIGAAAGAAALLPTGALSIGGTAATGTALTGTGEAVVGAGTVLAPAAETTGIVGAGTVLAPVAESGGGILSTVGGAVETVGSGFLKVIQALPLVGGFLGGGGGQQQQQGGMTQAEYDAQQAQAQAQAQAAYNAQQQAAYAAQQQQQAYLAAGYTGGSIAPDQTSYGDLRTPYTAVTEDGQQIQVDPNTGLPIQPVAGMSTEMKVGIAVVGITLLVGWYYMSGSEIKKLAVGG
jgi:hypothetical protein